MTLAQAAVPHPDPRDPALGADRARRPPGRPRAAGRSRSLLQQRAPLMIEPLARLGYASKAFIYAIVGLLAAAAALNRGGTVTDTRGALRVILSHPFGNIAALRARGGTVRLRRLAHARRVPRSRTARHRLSRPGHPDRSRDPRRWSTAASASRRSGWRAACARLTGTDATVRLWTATLLALPMGDWLVGLLGAHHGGLRRLRNRGRDQGHRRREEGPARAGSGAPADPEPDLPFRRRRARADHRRARHPAGASGVSRTIRARPPAFADRSWSWPAPARARWLLALTALGLMAYAVDQALHARYGRIRSPLR